MVEITMAIIIMGVLASLAIPRFAGTLELYRSKEGVMVLNQLLFAQLMAGVDITEGRIASYELVDTGPAIDDLDVQIPNMDNFNNPPTLNFNGAGAAPTVLLNGVNYPVFSSVVRSTGAYTLYIQGTQGANAVAGRVLCDPQPICRRMQYAPW